MQGGPGNLELFTHAGDGAGDLYAGIPCDIVLGQKEKGDLGTNAGIGQEFDPLLQGIGHGGKFPQKVGKHIRVGR